MKKLFSILILFFTGFLLFATERLIVDNIEVKDFKNSTDILGDGTAIFDPATSTLTLNNARLTKGAQGKAFEYAEFPAILFEGKLTIMLKGKNPGGALMMDKDGILSIAQGAALYEGNSEPGSLVKVLTLSGGLSKESKRFIKIAVP